MWNSGKTQHWSRLVDSKWQRSRGFHKLCHLTIIWLNYIFLLPIPEDENPCAQVNGNEEESEHSELHHPTLGERGHVCSIGTHCSNKVHGQGLMDMWHIMCFCLDPLPWSLASPDNSLIKTTKAKLLHLLEKNRWLISLLLLGFLKVWQYFKP